MTKTALLLAGAALGIAAPAQAQDRGFYVGVEGGVLLEDQVDIDLADTDPQTNAAFGDTDTGFDVDIIFGYDFGAFRIEAEAGYKQADYESLTIVNPALVPGGVPIGTVVDNDDDLQIFSGMLNGLVEFGSDVQFYAGGGVGFANLDGSIDVAGLGEIVDDSSTDFAWQLLAGARVAVNEKIDLGVKYRYFVANEFELDTVAGQDIEADFQSHSILARLRTH